MDHLALENADFQTFTENHRTQSRSQNWSQMTDMDVDYRLKLVPASDEVAVARYDDFREVNFA